MKDERTDNRMGGSARTIGADDALLEVVVKTVADEVGVDPLELTPLYDAIDPDALVTLCTLVTERDNQATGGVVFQWNDCLVEVGFDGTVTATPAAQSHANPFANA